MYDLPKEPSEQDVIQYLKGYDPTFAIHPNNILTEDKARALFEKGKKFTLLFGDPENPDYFVNVYEGDYTSGRRIDIVYLENLERQRVYFTRLNQKKYGARKEMLLTQYLTDLYDVDGNRGTLFVADVFVDGDLPTLEFNRKVWHAVSVPWQDFYLGPPPTFDELIDGSYVARLPKITMPPEHLLEPHIHQKDRKASDPKRTPKGRFPW